MPHKLWYDCDDGRVADATLVWILFFYIFRDDTPPLSQVAIPASHGLKPLTGAWVGTIFHGNPVRRPRKYWLPSRRGLTYFFLDFSPSFFCRESIPNQTPLHIPLPLEIEDLLTELICCEFFLSSWLPTPVQRIAYRSCSEHGTSFLLFLISDLPLFFLVIK